MFTLCKVLSIFSVETTCSTVFLRHDDDSTISLTWRFRFHAIELKPAVSYGSNYNKTKTMFVDLLAFLCTRWIKQNRCRPSELSTFFRLLNSNIAVAFLQILAFFVIGVYSFRTTVLIEILITKSLDFRVEHVGNLHRTRTFNVRVSVVGIVVLKYYRNRRNTINKKTENKKGTYQTYSEF